MQIKVITKQPGSVPRSTHISNNLESLQKYVGGYIETVTLAKDLVVICNEEGRLLRLPFNCEICGKGFCGPIILCGVKDDEFSDIPADFQTMKRLLPGLWNEARYWR